MVENMLKSDYFSQITPLLLNLQLFDLHNSD